MITVQPIVKISDWINQLVIDHSPAQICNTLQKNQNFPLPTSSTNPTFIPI